MAYERLAPDAALVQSNLTGALSAVQDDPDLPDVNWLEATSDSANVDLRVSFPSPMGNLVPWGTQELRVLVRQSAALGNSGTCTVELWEAGVLKKTLVAATTVSSLTGVVLVGTFLDTDLTSARGDGVECRVVGTTPGGKASSKRVIDVGAVEWNAQYEPWPPPDTVWPPTSIQTGGIYETGDLGTLRKDLIRTYGWTETTPNAAEQARLDATQCSALHAVSGTVLVSPDGVRHLKAYCAAPHSEALTLWPPHKIGANSGLT